MAGGAPGGEHDDGRGGAEEPDPFVHSFVWPVGARALAAAVNLGLFEALGRAPASPAELATALGCDPPGVEALLAALAVMGYASAGGDGRYHLAPAARRLLVGSSPESIANFAGPQADLHWDILRPLEEVIRTGRPYRLHEDRPDHPGWEGYIRGLWEIQRADAGTYAGWVPVDDPRRLVDVGGGHGGFAMAMCRRFPSLRATVVDLAPSVRIGRRIVAEQGLADRVAFVEGDVFEVGLGDGADVVSVFNLVHHLPEARNRHLVDMARRALRPGGWLVLGDTEKPVPGSPSANGALSSLLFYAWSGGQSFEADRITAWLQDAGFTDVGLRRNPRAPWRIVVTGRR